MADNSSGLILIQTVGKSYQQMTLTLVNVYVALPVFTPVAGSSYAHFMEQNGGAQYVNSEFVGIFVGVNTI